LGPNNEQIRATRGIPSTTKKTKPQTKKRVGKKKQGENSKEMPLSLPIHEQQAMIPIGALTHACTPPNSHCERRVVASLPGSDSIWKLFWNSQIIK
jgi:hypothetical protein